MKDTMMNIKKKTWNKYRCILSLASSKKPWSYLITVSNKKRHDNKIHAEKKTSLTSEPKPWESFSIKDDRE
jgi:hypothetical protein